jgi:hypothetical protein
MAATFTYEDAVGSAEPDLGAIEQEHGLPKGILSAIQSAEGSGDTAVSPKGARGRFQFMPATAKKFDLDDPNDPVKSAQAAGRYLKYAKDTYKTDDPRVLAAEYNGGPTAARAVLAGKEPPAAETQKYVRAVSAKMTPAKQPFSYEDGAFSYEDAVAKPAATKQVAASDSPLGDYSSAFVNPVAEAAGNMVTGAVAKPVGDLAGLGAIAAHYLGLTDKLPMDVQRQVQEALTYQPRTPEGQKMARYNPIALVGQGLGAIADAAGNAIAKPDSPYNPLGAGVAEAIKQAPMLLGGPAVNATAPVLEAGAQRMMRSALKPPIGTPQAQRVATDTVNTLLDEGINVSRGGVQTMTDRVNALNNSITNLIQNSPAVINRDLVASRLHDVVDKFSKQVNPASDLKSIQGAWDEFTKTWGQQIPVVLAQELKQGTYRTLSGKYQGELRSADIEAQKALARGLKEEIANAVPEVRVLNAEESRYLNALPLVERRVLQDANKNPIGLGIISTSPTHLAAWMADKSALFKSLVARMLNTAGGAAEALAPVSGAAGAMTNEQQRRP